MLGQKFTNSQVADSAQTAHELPTNDPTSRSTQNLAPVRCGLILIDCKMPAVQASKGAGSAQTAQEMPIKDSEVEPPQNTVPEVGTPEIPSCNLLGSSLIDSKNPAVPGKQAGCAPESKVQETQPPAISAVGSPKICLSTCPSASTGLHVPTFAPTGPTGSVYSAPPIDNCVSDPSRHVSGSMRISQPHCPISGGEAEDSDHDYTYFYHADERNKVQLKVQKQAGTRCWRARGSLQANQGVRSLTGLQVQSHRARFFQSAIVSTSPVLSSGLQNCTPGTSCSSSAGLRTDKPDTSSLPVPEYASPLDNKQVPEYKYFCQADENAQVPKHDTRGKPGLQIHHTEGVRCWKSGKCKANEGNKVARISPRDVPPILPSAHPRPVSCARR